MEQRSYFKALAHVLAVACAFAGASAFAATAAKEQFFPQFTFKTGPAGPLGIQTNAGYIDYFNLINIRDGGINGVKIAWEECETARVFDKGMACYEKLKSKSTLINPVDTALAYALIKKTPIDKVPIMTGGYGRTDSSDGRVFPYVFPVGTNYWSQNTAKIKYIGLRLGGMNRLQGKKIVNLHHGSGFGTETKEILDIQAKKYGFTVIHIPVPHPGLEQEEQWKQIAQIKPDWVILRGIGVMNPVALKTAHKYGYPASRILGVTWAGAEEDVIPAGDAARGYIASALSLPGKDIPVIKEILKHVYGAGKGELQDISRVGGTYYNRGVSGAIIQVEAVRVAQQRFGKRPLTGEEVRWGIENMQMTDRRISELGAFGLSQPLKMSCWNHEGGGSVRFQRWNGKEWQPITGWIEGDQSLVRPLIEKSAMEYAKAEGITPRDCEKEEAARFAAKN